MTNCVKFQGPLTEQGAIVSFEAADNPSVKWLDKGGHIWSKKLQSDVHWMVFDVVPAKIVNKQDDLPSL
jgi:hypothetical protein